MDERLSLPEQPWRAGLRNAMQSLAGSIGQPQPNDPAALMNSPEVQRMLQMLAQLLQQQQTMPGTGAISSIGPQVR